MAVYNPKTDLQILVDTGTTTFTLQADSYDISIDRGVSVEKGVIAKAKPGKATIQLMKSDLTDLMSSPPYKANQLITISAQSITVFSGLIQNVTIRYVAETKQIAVIIEAEDLVAKFMNTNLASFSLTGTLSNREYKKCMDAIHSAANTLDSRLSMTQLGTGASGSNQRANTWISTQIGEILDRFVTGELGWVTSQRDSTNLYYYTRADIDSKQATTWSSTRRTVSNIHSTSTNHVCMNDIEMVYDCDGLANVVTAIDEDSGGTVKSTVTNSSSVTAYGRSAGNYEINIDNSTGALLTYGGWATAVANAANPKNIKSVSCPGVRRDGELSSIIQADNGDIQQVEFAATGFTTLQEIYLITNVRHSITPDHWEVTLDLWRGI